MDTIILAMRRNVNGAFYAVVSKTRTTAFPVLVKVNGNLDSEEARVGGVHGDLNRVA